MSADVRSDVVTAQEDDTAQVRARVWQQSGLGSKRWLARWFAVMGVIGAALLAASFVTPGAALEEASPAAVVTTIALCLVVCVIPSLRGERLHVVEVLAMVVFVDAVIAYVGSIVADLPGSEQMLMLLTWPTLIAAVYLPRPMVVAQVLAGTAAGASTFPELLTTPGVAALQIILLASSLAVVALVVTQLREHLVDALDLARHAASTDALTGVANRRGIEERLPALWASAVRRGECLEVVLIDIDHFKAVNDRHGHGGGDQVLVQVADIVSSSVRADDLVCRFGGEEFLVLAAVDQGADPGQVGERIRRAVEEESGPVSVTVSVGSTTIVPTQGVDALEALDQQVHVADQAMYESKRAGRNRLTLR